MCDINKFYAKVTEIEEYFQYVNTDIDNYMAFEQELYAAYAAHHELNTSLISEWFDDAERDFITALSIDLFLMKHYEFWDEEELDYYYEKAVHTDGLIFECMGYWFHTK